MALFQLFSFPQSAWVQINTIMTMCKHRHYSSLCHANFSNEKNIVQIVQSDNNQISVMDTRSMIQNNMDKSSTHVGTIYTKNSQTVKKGAAHAKKSSMKKLSCEIKGGGPEVAVVVW